MDCTQTHESSRIVFTCGQDARLNLLEQKAVLAHNDIQHLVERLDGLTNVLTTLSFLLCGGLITSLGYLITYWIKGA